MARARTNVYRERAANFQRYLEQDRQDQIQENRDAQRAALDQQRLQQRATTDNRRLDLQERGLALREQQTRIAELNTRLAAASLETKLASDEAVLARSVQQQEQMPFALRAINQINPSDPRAMEQLREVNVMYPMAFSGNSEVVRPVVDAAKYVQDSHTRTRTEMEGLAKDLGVSYSDLIETDEAGNQRYNPVKAREAATARQQAILQGTNLEQSRVEVDESGKIKQVFTPSKTPEIKEVKQETPAQIMSELETVYGYKGSWDALLQAGKIEPEQARAWGTNLTDYALEAIFPPIGLQRFVGSSEPEVPETYTVTYPGNPKDGVIEPVSIDFNRENYQKIISDYVPRMNAALDRNQPQAPQTPLPETPQVPVTAPTPTENPLDAFFR